MAVKTGRVDVNTFFLLYRCNNYLQGNCDIWTTKYDRFQRTSGNNCNALLYILDSEYETECQEIFIIMIYVH